MLPLTATGLAFSHPCSPVFNATQFLARRPSADLARRKPGVQIPSPPPHIPAGQSVASVEPAALAAFWGRAGAANAHGRVFDAGFGAAAGTCPRAAANVAWGGARAA